MDMMSMVYSPKEVRELKALGVYDTIAEGLATSKETETATIAWEPQAGKQELAYGTILDATTHIIGYGGGRGCGKTEVGIAATIARMIADPNINALYLRRTTRSLEEVISRVKRLLGDSGIPYSYNGMDKIFTLQGSVSSTKTHGAKTHGAKTHGAKTHGAKLRIFYTDGDGLDALQGSNINHLVIEEPQLIPGLEMVMVKCRAFWRSASAGTLPKMVLLFNPLGAGTKWLKENIVQYGEEPRTTPEGYRQVFIKALIRDNPLLLKNNPQYIAMLESAPEAYRRAWLEGDFDVVAGTAFERLTFEHNGVERFAIRDCECYVALDWGYTDPIAVGFYTAYRGTILLKFHEIRTTQKTPREAAAIIKEAMATYERDGCVFTSMVADPSIHSHQQGASIADLFHDEGLFFERAFNDREAGFIRMLDYINRQKLMVFTDLAYFWQSVPQLILSEEPKRDGDIDQRTKQDDHAYDETRYAVMSFLLS